ncbi:MAG TPA: hypothetical protein VKO45_00680 [Methanomicrobiales archaeon]|nr:hypothetical protein [Methanomicrobiales archaeon]
MQLPRGKFRSVIKGVGLNSLIQELAEVRYTGTISISWKREAITLVIQKGKYTLAEYGPLRGDMAWEEILALGETIIDAILSDFSEPEMKLALEFNDAWLLTPQAVLRPLRTPRERVRETAHPRAAPEPVARKAPPAEPARRAPVPAPPEEPEIPPATKKVPARESPVIAEVPESPPAWTKVDMTQAIAMAADQAGEEAPPPGGYDELALLHMEMSSLDDVDVEHIATKIRKNAKGIVKKLHLGHLMTEKEE